MAHKMVQKCPLYRMTMTAKMTMRRMVLHLLQLYIAGGLLLVADLTLVAARVVPGEYQERVAQVQVDGDASFEMLDEPDMSSVSSACARRALQDLSIVHSQQQQDAVNIFSHVSFAIHHNGSPTFCGTALPSLEALQSAIDIIESYYCDQGGDAGDDDTLDKYQVESFLTTFFASRLDSNECSSQDDENAVPGFLGFCDMGKARTVIQMDHQKLVPVHATNRDTNGDDDDANSSLPCRFYTREGLRITSLHQLKELAVKVAQKQQQEQDESLPSSSSTVRLDLYAVPAGRMFMFGPSHVGEIFVLDHVKDTNGKSLVLQTLALSPKVFDIYHFFSHQESEDLLKKALAESSETHRFHRSTTGTSGASIYNKRTSENAWDTHGATSLKVKRRCFSLLGIDEYHDEMSDGLQILRYNLTSAYIPHMDYLTDETGKEIYDYDTAGKGGNRFATILLYFNDLEEGAGGETVFNQAWPPGLAKEDRVPLKDAIQQLRDSGDAPMLKPGSWEEEMTATCRTRLAVKPNATRAVLFYSQFPNGEPDPMSNHGGCPVLKGTKYAANLWTWSGIRPEYIGAPLKRERTKDEIDALNPKQISAIFRNSGKDERFSANTKLFYEEDGYFGDLGPNDKPIPVNTYKGHVWNIKNEGRTLQTFVVGKDAYQEFVV